MIVVLEHIWLQSTGGHMMREVETEEEAFAEMRRFLEVNNIPSDVTIVAMIEECERFGEIVPRHKEVSMRQHGFIPPMVKKYANPCFGIYYGEGRPPHEILGRPEDYGLTIKEDSSGNVVRDENGYPMLVSDWYKDGNKWYMPLLVYLRDLNLRKRGVK